MRSFRCFAVALIALLSGCGDIERDNPYDEKSSRYDASLRKSSASGSASRLEYCIIDGACIEVMAGNAADCHSYGGTRVESCAASSSSQPPSSSAASSSSNASSSSAASSSSRASSSSAAAAIARSTFTDSRDGKVYNAVKIGTQTWMAENLNYSASGSECYNNQDSYCAQYGRLYDWNAAMSACPSGWHLPSNDEWDALYHYADGTNGTSSPKAGRYLKATDGWHDCGVPGSSKSYYCEDTYGFAALPGGYGISDGSFLNAGIIGRWWSASEYSGKYAYYRLMFYNYESARWDYYDKGGLQSVRCLQD